MNLKSIITEFSHKYGQNAAKLEKEILTYVRAGMKPADAIKTAFKSTQFSQQVENDLAAAQKQAAGLNIGAGASMTTALNEPWDGTGVTFSQRLHGTSTAMQQAMTATIKDQLKLGATAVQVARALYSGYNDGHVIRQQDTPGYMDRLVQFARKSTLSITEQRDLMRSVRVAKRQIESLAQNGAPTSALRAAYSKLLDTILSGNDKNIARAVNVAVNEKSRYIAERIARTEAGRAYFDGVIAKYQDDPTVVAYKWELGSRHPEPDICDMYADANLFGLGPGVYPKNLCPSTPAHPNCLCLLYPVYAGEVDTTKQTNDPQKGGERWLMTHLKAAANIIPAHKTIDAWQDVARGFDGFVNPASRLSNVALQTTQEPAKSVTITSETNNAEKITFELSDLPKFMYDTKTKRDHADAFIEQLNNAPKDADPVALQIYKTMGQRENFTSNGIAIQMAYKEGSNGSYTKRFGVLSRLDKIVVKVPKLSKGQSNVGTFNTWLHELGHVNDVIGRENTVGGAMSSESDTGIIKALATVSARHEQIPSNFQKLFNDYDVIYKKIGKKYTDELDKYADATQKRIDAMKYDKTSHASITEYIKQTNEEIKKYKSKSREMEIRIDTERRIYANGLNSLEDIFDAIHYGYAKVSKQVEYGHSPKYYSSNNNRIAEIVANYFALSVQRPDLIKLLKAAEPELCKALDDYKLKLLKGLQNGTT